MLERLLSCLHGFTKRRKRAIFQRFKVKRQPYQFQYTLRKKSKVKTKQPYDYRVAFKFLAKSFRFYYQLRRTRYHLGNYFYLSVNLFSVNMNLFLFRTSCWCTFPRCNFACDIREARNAIKHRHYSLLLPKSNKNQTFVAHTIIKKSFMQIPLFSFLKLNGHLTIKKKNFLVHALHAKKKLYSLAPKWLFVNHTWC